MDLVKDIWAALGQSFVVLESRFAALYLCFTVVTVYGIWLYRGRPSDFVRFLFPREVYFHRSNLVDIQMFLINLVLGVVGVFGAALFTPVVANFVLTHLIALQDAPFQPLATTWGRSAIATLIVIVVADFCKYWTHYLHHENKLLWPFHSLHHSAEVMTPITVSRNHPVYILIRNMIMSLGLGTAQALALFLLIGQIDILTIGGANVGYFLFNLLGANLRHSHVWLSFGPVLEHIFISPAQHQVHHSRAKKHFNKNYGEVFAIWDWMFGTLYVPDGQEELEFGLADAKGRPIEQPHGNLKDALIEPFIHSFEEATGIEFRTAPSDASSEQR
ncbi:sterol desaturase family protein [Ruegeria atlantica]|uniref:Fatty acid hydroxylase superfamily protein n=1 Tax=Ruegeria atlantica TaxID=81569 RepID=A0A0P1E4Y4_9RHOB|nr:sterol desaturase family protein [Ruegeria atlantica]CUH42254.1 Fatty acid hydroxylase superfamily protein [Ruegeria atlantica]